MDGEHDQSLGPSGAVGEDAPRPDGQRCFLCAFYSFKIYANDANNSGKCFGARDEEGTRWVYAGMWCPRYKENSHDLMPDLQ